MTSGTAAEGQEGFCAFGDGSILDTWTLVFTPDIILGPNPASP